MDANFGTFSGPILVGPDGVRYCCATIVSINSPNISTKVCPFTNGSNP